MKVFKFGAEWCGPCKALQTTIDSMVLPYPIQSVDISDEFELASQYNVRAVPTLVMVDDSGIEVKRVMGALTKEKLLEWLDEKF